MGNNLSEGTEGVEQLMQYLADREGGAGSEQYNKEKDSGREKQDSGSSSDSDDSDGGARASSSSDTSQTAGIVQSVAGVMKAEAVSLDDKLSSLVNLQSFVLNMKDTRRGEVGKHIIASGLLDTWFVLIRKITTSGVPAVRSERNSRWKMMEMIYQLLVKITDNSSGFSQQVASTDLIKHTIDVLKSQQHQDLCAQEPFLPATTWMIEFVGNCYGDFGEEDMRAECRQLVDSYLQIDCEDIHIKAGQTNLVIALKDQQGSVTSKVASSRAANTDQHGPVSPTDVEGVQLEGGDVAEGDSSSQKETLSRLLENFSGDEQKEKQAEQMCSIGLPRVFTDNVKEWYQHPDRWRAFNQEGKMWDSLLESFETMVSMSEFSHNFREALCEAGVVNVLQDILSNYQIQTAYVNNEKTQLVVAAGLRLIFYIVQLRDATKYVEVTNVWDILQSYLISKDVNIRGHAFLIVANLSKLDSTMGSFNMSFSTADVKLLVATFMTYTSEGGPMGDFLAKTNFPEHCVAEIRNCITRDPGNEVIQDEEWRDLLEVFSALLIFSRESVEFARNLARANIAEPIQKALSSPYFQARNQEQICRKVMEMSVLITLNCVRLADLTVKSCFLVPKLWPHIYRFSVVRNTEDHKHYAAFLAFVYMHDLVSDGTNRATTIDQFPQLNRSIEDVKYVSRIWCIIKSHEEKILGDYLAATGGATVHVALLGDLIGDLNTVTSNRQNIKLLLVNMNKLALQSPAFAEAICRSGLLGDLGSILNRNEMDLASMTDQEEELFNNSTSTIYACAQYPSNMQYFRSAGISCVLCKLMMANVALDTRNCLMKAVIFIRRHDPPQVDSHLVRYRVSSLSLQDILFYCQLYITCKESKIQVIAGDLLIDLGVAETMGRKLKQLVRDKALLTEFVVTEPLLSCMWNFTDLNKRFSVVLRDVGVFDKCQEIIRNPAYKNNLNDERTNTIVTASLVILLNSAQCEANHTALHNLRVLNDLLQFTKASDPQIKSVSTLATSFLVREENAHLVRTSAKSGVLRFLLEKLESGIEKEEHRSCGLTCMELLSGISRMALNDTNKAILVYDGILPILARILVRGSLEEKLLAANLTWSLTFQEDNKYCIQEEQALIDVLHDLSEMGESELKVKAKGALCQLGISRDRIYRWLDNQTHKENQCETGDLDVFLSHHPDSEPLFAQLESILETEGFVVMSLNHDSHSDDLFNKITSSIEKSRIVIIEVSRQYQQSLFCRTEAEYSNNLLKPLIPLRSQHGFKPAGWLAKLAIGRPTIDFSRYVTGNESEMEVNISRLQQEIKRALRQGQAKE